MPVQYRPPQIDFSSLATLPQLFQQGQDRRRQNDLRGELQSAIGPDGKFDFQKAASIVTKYDPVAGLKLMTEQAQADALSNYRTGQLGVAQENTDPPALKLARAWHNGELGSPPAAPQPEQASPFRLGPTDPTASAPSGVPGTAIAQPSGIDPRLTNAPAMVQDVLMPAQQKEELVKRADLKVKRLEDQPADWALVNQYEENGNLIQNGINQLLDSKGRPNEGLRSVSGNHEVNGVDTNFPNAWLPNVSQGARNTASVLSTIKTQIGLLQLAAMRAASAQGASGMGQLAIQESKWLQEAIANLDEGQEPGQVAAHLQTINSHIQNLKRALKYKYKSSHGNEWAPLPEEDNSAPQPGMDMATDPPAPDVPGATNDPRGAYHGPYPDGTVITNGKDRLIMQGGQWVPHQ